MYKVDNLDELKRFASLLSYYIEEGDVFSLVGDLGAGKTTLVQMIGKYLGVDDYITSPTYSIVNVYDGDFEIYHLDLYRLEDPSELESLDYEEYFYPAGVSFIEWASKGGDYLPEDMIVLEIQINNESRIINFVSENQRTTDIKEALDEHFSS